MGVFRVFEERWRAAVQRLAVLMLGVIALVCGPPAAKTCRGAETMPEQAVETAILGSSSPNGGRPVTVEWVGSAAREMEKCHALLCEYSYDGFEWWPTRMTTAAGIRTTFGVGGAALSKRVRPSLPQGRAQEYDATLEPFQPERLQVGSWSAAEGLPATVARTFEAGQYEARVLAEDMTVFRGEGTPFGRWFGTVEPESAAHAEQLYNIVGFGNDATTASGYLHLPPARRARTATADVGCHGRTDLAAAVEHE